MLKTSLLAGALFVSGVASAAPLTLTTTSALPTTTYDDTEYTATYTLTSASSQSITLTHFTTLPTTSSLTRVTTGYGDSCAVGTVLSSSSPTCKIYITYTPKVPKTLTTQTFQVQASSYKSNAVSLSSTTTTRPSPPDPSDTMVSNTKIYVGTGGILAAIPDSSSNYDWYKATVDDGSAFSSSLTFNAVSYGTKSDGSKLLIAVGDAVSGKGSIYYTSGSPVTWTKLADGNNPSTANLNSIAYANHTWVAVGDSGNLLSSTNGTTWQTHSLPSTVANSDPNLTKVIAHKGNFIVIGADGTLLESANGVNWVSKSSQTSYSGSYANVTTAFDKIFALGVQETFDSYYGINWEALSSPDPSTLSFTDFLGTTVSSGEPAYVGLATDNHVYAAYLSGSAFVKATVDQSVFSNAENVAAVTVQDTNAIGILYGSSSAKNANALSCELAVGYEDVNAQKPITWEQKVATSFTFPGCSVSSGRVQYTSPFFHLNDQIELFYHSEYLHASTSEVGTWQATDLSKALAASIPTINAAVEVG